MLNAYLCYPIRSLPIISRAECGRQAELRGCSRLTRTCSLPGQPASCTTAPAGVRTRFAALSRLGTELETIYVRTLTQLVRMNLSRGICGLRSARMVQLAVFFCL